MTLPHPHSPHSSLHHIKPHLSPPQQLTPSSSLSPTPSPSVSTDSLRSSSDTYVNDLGGPCVPDPHWPPPVSRIDAYRVYDSSDDEEEPPRHVTLRKHALEILETVDVGVYDEWAVQADDALSIEELQACADDVANAIEAGKAPTKRRARSSNGVESLDDADELGDVPIPVMDMLESESSDGGEKGIWAHLRGARHRRIETLPDDDLSDIMITDDVQVLANGVSAEPSRGHRRIETLDDVTGEALGGLPAAVPPLPPGKRGHRRIETLDDGFDTSEGIYSMPTGSTPPLPPGKRGHRRIETLTDDTDICLSSPHTMVETLGDIDLCEAPALKRVETLPDEPLDTPVLNGVQRMGFEDVMSIPVPPPLPSPVASDDTPRGMFNSDIDNGEQVSGFGRIETLSEDDTIDTELDRRRGSDASKGECYTGECTKLPELSSRVKELTRSLADVQMVTASHAACAEATLPRADKGCTRGEISHLRITLDHLARLILEQAHKTADGIDSHRQ